MAHAWARRMKQISGKPKPCKQCKKDFIPERPFQRCCSPRCAIRYVSAAKKEQKQSIKQQKEKLKTRSDWLKEVQVAFNKWIRELDFDKPCISCGRHHNGQYHAGHYRSVKACPALRFNRLNVHKQCRPCNELLSGNIIEYRKNLIKKIGVREVEWLEKDHPPAKYTIDELKAMKKLYNKLARELKKMREA